MSEWGAGRDPSSSDEGPRPNRPHSKPTPHPDDLPPAFDEAEDPAPSGMDPVAIAAVAVGLIGIVIFGILAALIGAILGGMAGQRARESGRSLELPYIALLLAGVDGIVWIALHALFEIPYTVG